MQRMTKDLARHYVETTQGSTPSDAQAVRLAKTAGAMTAMLEVTAKKSLFDTEPAQLEPMLRALADDEGLSDD